MIDCVIQITVNICVINTTMEDEPLHKIIIDCGYGIGLGVHFEELSTSFEDTAEK